MGRSVVRRHRDRFGHDRRHPSRVLDLRVVAELGQLGDGDAGVKLAEGREHRGRRDRVLQAPGEAEALPVADRPVPARRQLDPLVEVVDEPVADRPAAGVADQCPLVIRLGGIERMTGREEGAELVVEEAANTRNSSATPATPGTDKRLETVTCE